jgi:two-component system response regulator HydG
MPPTPQEPVTSQTRTGAARVLVVDDQPDMADAVSEALRERDYDVVASTSGREAARLLTDQSFDALVTDLRMPDKDGLALVAHARKYAPDCQIIVMTAFSAVDTAVESIRQGAYHYLTKPFKMTELALFLERALAEAALRRETRALRRALHDQTSTTGLLGESAALKEVLSRIDRVAESEVPVLILGETGTGKGLAARTIHAQSTRARGPFVTLNCAALPESLLESELFGHVKGAFTGASSSRAGVFVEATGGTLFLDEIGEMSPSLQSKLLRVLEHAAVRPLGGTGERAVDVRVVAATHRDLRASVERGAFRQDLLYRLEVVSIELPSLRHRREDIPLLVAHFFERARRRNPQSPVEEIGADVLALLMAHAWPGNVRELIHAVERLVLLARGRLASPADLPPALLALRPTAAEFFAGEIIPVRELQTRYAAWALEQLGGRKMLTCEKLGIEPKTLARWLADGASATDEKDKAR